MVFAFNSYLNRGLDCRTTENTKHKTETPHGEGTGGIPPGSVRAGRERRNKYGTQYSELSDAEQQHLRKSASADDGCGRYQTGI